MEVLEEYVFPTLNTLSQHVPPSLSLQMATYATTANTYVQTFRDTYADPYVFNPLNSLLNSPPDLYSILILFFVLVISLKVLDYARRVITFWVILVLRLAFWGAIIGGGWYVYTVGWDKASRNAGWVLGLLEGFIRQIIAESGDGGAGASDGRSRYGSAAGSRQQRFGRGS